MSSLYVKFCDGKWNVNGDGERGWCSERKGMGPVI